MKSTSSAIDLGTNSILIIKSRQSAGLEEIMDETLLDFARRLALASALWNIVTAPRALSFPMCDHDEPDCDCAGARADRELDIAAYVKATIDELARGPQREALALLRDDATVRAEVRGFVERALAVFGYGPEDVAAVQAFGPGWQELGSVSLEEAVAS